MSASVLLGDPVLSGRSRSVARAGLCTAPDVAFLLCDLQPSGVVRNVVRIAEEAIREGLDAALILVRDPDRLAEHAVSGPIARHILLPDAPYENRHAAMLRAVVALRRWLAVERPRVLFSGGSHVHPLAAAATVGLEHPPRLILRASNDIVHERPGRLMGWASRAASFAAAPAIKAVALQADHIVCVSNDLHARMRQLIQLPADRLSVNVTGVDRATIEVAAAEDVDHPWFADGEPPVVLGVGRLSAQKNFGPLIDAVAAVRRVEPVRLVILGGGSCSIRRGLMQRARAQGIAQDVDLPGHEPNPHRYMARAAMLAMTSLWEGMPNVALEALAVGCPVIAAGSPSGLAEALHANGEPLGAMTPAGDAAALASAIMRQLHTPRRSQALARRAAAFDHTQMLNGYLDVIRRYATAARSCGSTPERRKS